MRKATILMTLSLLAALVLPAPLAAAPKVDVCHKTGNGDYILISINENALPAHLAHGDGQPGDAVPGSEGKVFGEQCDVEDAPLEDYVVITSGELAYGDGGYAGWSCPEGTVVVGGGFEATEPVAVSAPGLPGSAWPHYTFGADESGWVVRDAPDGVGNTITIYVVCAEEPSGYEVAESSEMAFGDGGFGGWSCPAGTVVLGGGFEATDAVAASAPGTPDSVWPHYTFGADEYGWVVRDDPNSAGNNITIYAICALPVDDYEVVSSTQMAFGDGGFGGWSCPNDTRVLSGGFNAEDTVTVSAPGLPGSAWPHYTFGADESGWVIQDDANGAGNNITVYAVCAG